MPNQKKTVEENNPFPFKSIHTGGYTLYIEDGTLLLSKTVETAVAAREAELRERIEGMRDKVFAESYINHPISLGKVRDKALVEVLKLLKNLEQAIRDAVEKGGYPSEMLPEKKPIKTMRECESDFYLRHAILLDPAFWRALGKARGWEEKNAKRYLELRGVSLEEYRLGSREFIYGPQWKWNMCRLTLHLAEGKDIESFFASL